MNQAVRERSGEMKLFRSNPPHSLCTASEVTTTNGMLVEFVGRVGISGKAADVIHRVPRTHSAWPRVTADNLRDKAVNDPATKPRALDPQFMKIAKRVLQERPRVFFMILYLPVLSLLCMAMDRFVLQIAVGLLVSATLAVFAWPKRPTRSVVYNLCLICCLLSLLSPLDVALRNSSRLRLKLVSVIPSISNISARQRAGERGLVENEDYVIYDHAVLYLGPYWAILITIPSHHRITTPL